ncbi:MAG: response regulator [Acidobacteria bacterium]|nr:response regulator [Acidobacteriota bacterium]
MRREVRKQTEEGPEKLASVLLAEDEPNVLFTFRAVLEEAGYEVLPAPTLSEARKSIERKQFDAIITALSFADEGSGLELAREAKNLSSPPAVLVYSADPSIAKMRAAMDARVDYFAFQPIDLDEIKSALFRLVARRSDLVALG